MGRANILEHFREVWRWHTEAFSFASNSYTYFDAPTQEKWHTPCPLEPVGGKYVAYRDPYSGSAAGGNANYDAYALVPIELPWEEVGSIAYWNEETGLKITHFPAIHTRKGSISFKVEFTPPGLNVPPITMIYSGDTRPNQIMLEQAKNVDVLAHEIVMPPDQWTSHMAGLPVSALPPANIEEMKTVINSSHTTQGAFGYLLSQLMAANALPRLTAATHFQAQDDTIALAEQSIAAYGIPRDRYTFPADFMVLNVTSDKSKPVRQRRADVSRYAFNGLGSLYIDSTKLNIPKYHDPTNPSESDPYAQIDNTYWIPWTGYYGPNNPITYNENGY